MSLRHAIRLLAASLTRRGTPLSLRQLGSATNNRQFSALSRQPLRRRISPTTHRTFITFIGRTIVSQVFKIRTWIAGGAVIGGSAAAQRYDDWKASLPELKWIEDNEQLAKMKANAIKIWTLAGDVGKEESMRVSEWFDGVLPLVGVQYNGVVADTQNKWDAARREWTEKREESRRRRNDAKDEMERDTQTAMATAHSDASSSEPKLSEQERNAKLQDEILAIQTKYQRELERVEKENKELKKQLLLRLDKSDPRRRKMSKSLIDMYSDVLDQLNTYDSSYDVQDNLPRVVVVGDQSSGKTSVLEMIAQARIFPRGAGEMMTRAPVKVTLSEGPYHIAKFSNSNREFDLTKESDLEALRAEIEIRMKNSVKKGRTISTEVIALTVKGANMPRMVLVDLPGVISTVTTDMASDTRDAIAKLCRQYMQNPNAIILCIQDGSVDAERSNVTDMVSQMDPTGRRTIMVLTKVDMAEKNLADPTRIRRILEGKLFPMKALGYFAVVTGKGSTKDSIESIRRYEEEFFGSSQLFREAGLKPSSLTTRNMSLMVSECFWRMVKDAVEQQADAFRATRFNLETEWKNNFPRQRQLDREELFDRARSEILDEIINLEQISSEKWEDHLVTALESRMSAHVFDNVYLPASLVKNAGSFNTMVDIKLKHWAEKDLANQSLNIAWELLRTLFADQIQMTMNKATGGEKGDPIFDQIKEAVVSQSVGRHEWDNKAIDYLRVIQTNAMDDREVPDKKSWDATCAYMRRLVQTRLGLARETMQAMQGPTFSQRWLSWQTSTDDNLARTQVVTECERLVEAEPEHSAALTADDMTVIRRNLDAAHQTGHCPLVADDTIRDTWHHFYRLRFLHRTLQASSDCKSFYYHYRNGFADSDVECQAIPLFYRVSKMISLTSNALRQQITNTEQRRIEKEIKETLEEWSQDTHMKKELLTGRRVQLAEELKQVRAIQDRLEEFIKALNSGKKP